MNAVSAGDATDLKYFFWTKKELMVEFVAMRLAAAEKKNAKKKRWLHLGQSQIQAEQSSLLL